MKENKNDEILTLEQMRDALSENLETNKLGNDSKVESKKSSQLHDIPTKPVKNETDIKKDFNRLIESTATIYSHSNDTRGPKEFSTGQFDNSDITVKMAEEKEFTESKIKQYKVFKENRKKKAEGFNLVKKDDQALVETPKVDIEKEAIQEEVNPPKLMEIIANFEKKSVKPEIEIDEKQKEQEVLEYIRTNKAKVKREFFLTGGLFFITFIWHLLVFRGAEIPNELTPLKPIFYLTINLAILALGGYFSLDTIKNGLFSFIKKTIDKTSLIFVTCTVSALQILLLYFSGDTLILNDNVCLFSSFALSVLTINSFSEYIKLNMTLNNILRLKILKNKFGAKTIDDLETAQSYTRGSIEVEPHVAYNKETCFVNDVVSSSFNENILTTISFYMIPIIGAVALLSGIFGFAYSKDVWIGLSAFTGTVAISTSLSLLLCLTIPQLAYLKRFKKIGSIFLGGTLAEDIGDVNAVAVQACGLFPSGTVELNGMRAFNKQSIYQSIIYCTSLLTETSSVLKDAFINVIQQNKKFLLKAENVIFEDGLGFSGWIDDKFIIIGNYNIMVNHNVEMPPRSETDKLHRANNDIIYISIDATLSAAFVYSLRRSEEIKNTLDSLCDNGILLVAQTVDPIITSQKLAEVFSIPRELFKTLPGCYNKSYNVKVSSVKELKTSLINSGGVKSFIRSIVLAKGFKNAIRNSIGISLFSIILQLIIFATSLLSNNLFAFSEIPILLFNLLTIIVTFIVCFLKK